MIETQSPEIFEIQETSTKQERKFGELILTDFLNMDEEDQFDFRRKVVGSNGTVQIWIHSHYNETGDTSPKSEEYKQIRDKALSSINPENIPVLSFIEAPPGFEWNIDEYGKMYSKLMKGKVYVIPTFQDTSVPCIENTEDLFVRKHETEIKNWDILGSKLAQMGVTKVIVRGRNFEYATKPIEKMSLAEDIYAENNKLSGDTVTVPDKCAGNAVVQLSARGFEILSTRVTYPEKLK
ncbi:hypothetical protein C4561_04940 [candidate division WWE3 bacterium]|jgi:hypothetical protein|uniref:Uncharacterized protein n=1 Tax=candidate division WWE3 bacterium TaxID=2053526 RepID=A0A3A4ZII1_UNCKA|nr:MAG: hypothetical protein C4561_04940 [candidate division WWE3 bacterium]